MSPNSFGTILKIHTFGESHGVAVGVVIDGCPAGITITSSYIQDLVNERKPNQNSYTSPRNEEDRIEILSGIYQNKTLGTPISIIVYNKDARSQDYDNLKTVYRPSHADHVWKTKFTHVDHRGGGRSSARETLTRVIAGAVAYRIIEETSDIKIYGFLSNIGGQSINYSNLDYNEINNNMFYSPDKTIISTWQQILNEAIKSKDSVGSQVEIHIKNCPVGLGEPVFNKLNAKLAHGLFSIPAVKGLEFGQGNNFTNYKGSQVNDALYSQNNTIKYTTNNNGGILGGISNGEDIVIKITIKPTSSIGLSQTTLDHSLQPTNLEIKGRHDPCIGIRATAVCKTMCALVLADNILIKRLNNI